LEILKTEQGESEKHCDEKEMEQFFLKQVNPRFEHLRDKSDRDTESMRLFFTSCGPTYKKQQQIKTDTTANYLASVSLIKLSLLVNIVCCSFTVVKKKKIALCLTQDGNTRYTTFSLWRLLPMFMV